MRRRTSPASIDCSGLAKDSQKLIDIVQVASTGSDMSVQRVFTHLIARRQLNSDRNYGQCWKVRCSAVPVETGETAKSFVVLRCCRPSAATVSVKFEVPRGAAGISKFADYFVLVVLEVSAAPSWPSKVTVRSGMSGKVGTISGTRS